MSEDNVSQATPTGEFQEDSYVSRSGEKNQAIPVQSDNDPVEDSVDEGLADTDEQLARDDNDAIDKSNIIDERTRGAKPTDTYREPGDDEGIPDDSGRSAVSQ